MKKRIFLFILIIISTSIFYTVKNGIYENNEIDNMINEFKSKGIKSVEYYNKIYYTVSRETYKEYEDLSGNRPAITYDEYLNPCIGSPGDILLTKNAPSVLGPAQGIVGYLFGGHAAFVASDTDEFGNYGDVGDKMIEVAGFQGKGNDIVALRDSNWTTFGRETIIGLRIKGFSKQNYFDVLNRAKDEIGKKYNYTFIVNTKNSYYCTDFVSRIIYSATGINLNDGFVSTCNDIILSDDVYMFYYQEKDENGINHIYYLDN